MLFAVIPTCKLVVCFAACRQVETCGFHGVDYILHIASAICVESYLIFDCAPFCRECDIACTAACDDAYFLSVLVEPAAENIVISLQLLNGYILALNGVFDGSNADFATRVKGYNVFYRTPLCFERNIADASLFYLFNDVVCLVKPTFELIADSCRRVQQNIIGFNRIFRRILSVLSAVDVILYRIPDNTPLCVNFQIFAERTIYFFDLVSRIIFLEIPAVESIAVS